MSYTDVFGGNLLFPSLVSYNRIDTAVDVTLQWPREQQIEGVNVVADVMDINGTVPNLNVDMPDARNASTGNKTTVNGIGDDFVLRDATGGTIQSVDSGQAWVIVLTDNTTEAGTWTTFQLGAGTTISDSSALAGAGLQPSGSLLEQIMASDVEAATPFDVVTGDRAKCLIYTAGAGTCNLQAQNDNFFCMIRNSGSGTLNVVPAAGQIDGAASINLDPDASTFLFTDGTDWFTVGLTTSSVIAFDFVSLAVPGSGDFVLSGANLNRISYRFTGALTGNRRIIVPNTTQQYWADNQTSGAFSLEVVTAAGAGITIPQGQSVITYCDATDVINATSSTSVAFPITIGQGGTSATTASGARTNLNAAFDGILIETQALSGLAGGGDLTANMQLLLDVDNLTAETTIDTAADFLAVYDADAAAMRKFLIEDVVPSPDSLIDSGGNVRAFASTGGLLQLRSDANADALPRELAFTHQDGTVALFIGQDSFSEEMDIQNRINAADGLIRISTTHASAYVSINTNYRQGAGNPQFRGAADNTVGINLMTTSFGGRAFIGYSSSNTLVFQNSLDSAQLELIVRDSLSQARTMVQLNPNADVKLYYQPGGGAIEVARTLDDGDGGFEVNNLLTASGFERVLTESDAPAIVQRVKTADESVNNSTTYQNDNHIFGMELVPGKYSLEGAWQGTQPNAATGLKFRWSSTGTGTFGGSQGYSIVYRADTGASPSDGDMYWTTVNGVTGALINALQTGEMYGFWQGLCGIDTNSRTLTLQWAQVVAFASNSFLNENTWQRWTRTDAP